MKGAAVSWPLRARAELELRRRRALRAPEVEAEPEQPGLMFRAQPGPQMQFYDSTADITIIGGSVFGGKTFALTLEPTKHLHVPGFTFATFRRVTPEIRNPGGLWDEAVKMYPAFSGDPREQQLEWSFPSTAKGKFSGLQYNQDVLSWKSSQICLLMFDQLEEFSEYQFWYMLSRNRSLCGVKPYVRASCNPDPDSWLADFLSWWIDQDTGYAIPERSGVSRWFVRIQNEVVWGDTREELVERYPAEAPLSVCFIRSRLEDNRIGTEKDPGYKARMEKLPLVERERLLGGNWKIRASAGLVFDRGKCGEPVGAAPVTARRVRCWDKAATPGGGDWTAGVLLAHDDATKITYVEDVVRGQWSSGHRKQVELETARRDREQHGNVHTHFEQEPGAGGKESAETSVQNLQGYSTSFAPVSGSGDKVERAGPFASQWQAGNVRLVKGPWNEPYLRELHAFPTKGVPDDQVDGTSGAYNKLTINRGGTVGQSRRVTYG